MTVPGLSRRAWKLSNHFATQRDDKFAEIMFDNGAGDAPLLDGCAARFQCKKSFTYEGGDHLIIVGEVIQFDNTGRPALLYHEGHYAVSEAHPVAEAKRAEQGARGGFVDDYLDYLLIHASAKFQKNFQPLIDKAGLNHYQWRVLASLSDRDDQDISELCDMTLIPASETDRARGTLRQPKKRESLALAPYKGRQSSLSRSQLVRSR